MIAKQIYDIGKASVTMAMNAIESENLFAVSMGKMSNSAAQWSKELGRTLGLNQYELRKNVATFNVMFTAMGINTDKAYELSKGLTQLAYDMASFYNLKPEEAFLKLTSGITGEMEPLKRLGILVDEDTVKHYAYKTSIAKVGEALTQQEKVYARYGTIMEQTIKAQGDLARTMDSPANQIRLLKSRTEELQTTLGMAFLPTLVAITGQLTGMATATGVSNSGLQTMAKVISFPIASLLGLKRMLADVRIASWEATIAFRKFNPFYSKEQVEEARRERLLAIADAAGYNQEIINLKANIDAMGKFDYAAASSAEKVAAAQKEAGTGTKKHADEVKKATEAYEKFINPMSEFTKQLGLIFQLICKQEMYLPVVFYSQ